MTGALIDVQHATELRAGAAMFNLSGAGSTPERRNIQPKSLDAPEFTLLHSVFVKRSIRQMTSSSRGCCGGDVLEGALFTLISDPCPCAAQSYHQSSQLDWLRVARSPGEVGGERRMCAGNVFGDSG